MDSHTHIRFVVLLSISLFWLFACGEEPILIGFSGPLTGVYSDLGVQGRNGVTLALETVNAQGGIAGRELRLLARDDGGSPAQARAADKALIKEGVTAIIGHMTSSQSLAALPVVEEAGMVLLSPTASTPLLSGKKDLFFRVQGSTGRTARALARFVRKELGVSRVTTIRDTDNQAYSGPFAENFTKTFEQGDGKVLRACSFSSSRDPDWQAKAACLKLGDPDGILFIASARETARLVQALGSFSEGCVLFCSGWAATSSLLTHGGRAVEGLYLARTGASDIQSPAYKDFQKKYLNRFGRMPSFAAEQGYHALMVLSLALAETGGGSDGLPGALSRIEDYPSLYGPLSLDAWGDALAPVTILKTVRRRFIPVAKIRDDGVEK